MMTDNDVRTAISQTLLPSESVASTGLSVASTGLSVAFSLTNEVCSVEDNPMTTKNYIKFS